MPQTYRQVIGHAEVPTNGALIRLWSENGRPRATVDTGDDASPHITDPDLALFEASLALARHDLAGLYVWLDDEAIWDEQWGRLAAE